MDSPASSSTRPPLAPHSRTFSRGSLGDAIDGRSREGRYLRRIEHELEAHIGGAPNFAQKLLIRRAARAMLRLELLDEKMASGNWTDHDARTFGGLSNMLRLCLRELGVKAAPAKTPSLQDYLAATAEAPEA